MHGEKNDRGAIKAPPPPNGIRVNTIKLWYVCIYHPLVPPIASWTGTDFFESSPSRALSSQFLPTTASSRISKVSSALLDTVEKKKKKKDFPLISEFRISQWAKNHGIFQRSFEINKNIPGLGPQKKYSFRAASAAEKACVSRMTPNWRMRKWKSELALMNCFFESRLYRNFVKLCTWMTKYWFFFFGLFQESRGLLHKTLNRRKLRLFFTWVFSCVKVNGRIVLTQVFSFNQSFLR